MSSNWKTVQLSDIATQYAAPFSVVADDEYMSLGVKWYAAGVFAREPKLGSAIKGSRLFRVKPQQFIYNRMFATEGSFALVPSELASGVVSNEFPVFDLDESSIVPEYLAFHFQQRRIWEFVAQECVGTTKSRSRWKEERFLAHQISLPPLAEQRRIVDLIGTLDDSIATASAHAENSQRLLQQLRAVLIETGTADIVPAANAFEITMGRQRSPKYEQGDGMTPYLRSANIKPGTLLFDDVKIMDFSDREIEKYRLQPGDVLVTEGSGSLETVGAPAQWNNELASPVCFQNTLLRYRAVNDVSIPDYVYHWCQWAFESGKFLDIASGTNIKHIGSTRAIKVPVRLHPLERQYEICDELEALENVAVSTKETAAALRTLRSEMLTSLLSGAHTIPESYDALLETVDA